MLFYFGEEDGEYLRCIYRILVYYLGIRGLVDIGWRVVERGFFNMGVMSCSVGLEN